MEEQDSVSVETIYKRVFLNHVERYVQRNIHQILKDPFVENIYETRRNEAELESEQMINVLVKKKQLEVTLCGTADEQYLESFQQQDFVKVQEKERIENFIKESDILIYDISAAKEDIIDVYFGLQVLEEHLNNLDQPKVLILISTIMTWSRSQPLGTNDIAIPFSEEDFRRRKPHPSYLEHLKVEKMVTKLGSKDRNKLRTFIVAPGICYGDGEGAFHNLFKMAWLNSPELPVYGSGDNLLPTIYVKDLARAIQTIIYNPPKYRYLIAMDDSLPQLKDIIAEISECLGTGRIKFISREEALLDENLDQASFNQLTVNLRMESNFLKENPLLKWDARNGMTRFMPELIKEYKERRNLKPFRICVLGPPTVGKTTIVKKLCESYHLHHIEPNEILDAALEQLKESEDRLEKEELDEETKKQATEDAATRRELLDCKDEMTGRYEAVDDKIITKYIREKLLSKPCQNQGFLLDGYPVTRSQAKMLFDAEHEEEESDDESDATNSPGHFDPLLTPEHVYALDADEEWLRQRILRLDEVEVMRTQNTEDNFLKRMKEYTDLLNEDDRAVNFFPRRGISVVHVDVASLSVASSPTKNKEDSKAAGDRDPIMRKLVETLGEPRNFAMTPSETESHIRTREIQAVQQEIESKKQQDLMERTKLETKKRQIAVEATKLEASLREEYEIFDAQSLPMRVYLMRHVMPVLTEGIINCVKDRPDDPRDYLAKYLFFNNPLENLK